MHKDKEKENGKVFVRDARVFQISKAYLAE